MNAGKYTMWQQLAITEDSKFLSALEWQHGDKTVQKFIHLWTDEAEMQATVAGINSYYFFETKTWHRLFNVIQLEKFSSANASSLCMKR